MKIITSIDLGSNSLRVLRFCCDTKQIHGEFEKTVGTADGLIEAGIISDDAQKRIILAIKESIEKLNYDPKQAFAVTTQAMRIAKNNSEVLLKIKENTGVQFNIINPNKEAELTLLAVNYAIKREQIKSDSFMLLDIGGGSTELILVSKNETFTHSFPFGIVTLTQSKNYNNDFLSFKNYILKYLENSKFDIKKAIFLSTAGTPTTICAVNLGMNYQTYDKNKVNGKSVYLKDVIRLQNEFKNMSNDDLESKVGSGRIAYINTGVEIFKLFFEVLGKEYSIVFDDGLREGVAIESCSRK